MASPDELWLVDFGDPYPAEPGHRRPAMIIGPPEMFGRTPFIVLCPLTTVQRALPVHIEIEASEHSGLRETSYVQTELVRSISRTRLLHRIGLVGLESAAHVRESLHALLLL